MYVRRRNTILCPVWVRHSRTKRLFRPTFIYKIDSRISDVVAKCTFHPNPCHCPRQFKIMSWVKFLEKWNLVRFRPDSQSAWATGPPLEVTRIELTELKYDTAELISPLFPKEAKEMLKNKNSVTEFVTRTLHDDEFAKTLFNLHDQCIIVTNMALVYMYFTNLCDTINWVRWGLSCLPGHFRDQDHIREQGHRCPAAIAHLVQIYAFSKYQDKSEWEQWICAAGNIGEFLAFGEWDLLPFDQKKLEFPFHHELCEKVEQLSTPESYSLFRDHVKYEPKSLASLAAYKSNLVIHQHMKKHNLMDGRRCYYTHYRGYENNPYFNDNVKLSRV